MAVIGLMAAAANLNAQPPQGAGMPQMPPVLNPEEKTAQMTEKYKLTDEQKQAVLELNQKAYEDELKGILDKKQFRKYRSDVLRAQAEREQAMQRGFGGGFPGGGFPGGGMPGGGFPGGGFPGGGFPGGF